MADTSDAGEIWGDYVKEELDRQVARKASFEQRGLAVITTSGVLVTLLFGLAALSTKEKQTFALPGASKVLLLVALGFFVLAIGAALATNVPLIYRNVTPEALTGAVKSRWAESPSAAAGKSHIRESMSLNQRGPSTPRRRGSSSEPWPVSCAPL